MKSKLKGIIISLLTVVLLVASVGVYSFANGSDKYKSQGTIVFTNDTDDTSDDVIFDASDFTTIDTMITDGKSQLATSLNAYPNTNVTSLDTFANLSSAIDTITEIPSIYYYDKATEGDDCERYILEDGNYYPCDMYGVKTSDTALSGTITVVAKDDTTEPAAGEIQLVQYVGTGDANLSAGYAGYADKSFILGSGSDNITYRNSGIIYADGRINISSKSYISGYIVGKEEGPAFTTQTVTVSGTSSGNNMQLPTATFSFPHRVLGITNLSGTNANCGSDAYSVGVWNDMIQISGNNVTLWLRGLDPYTSKNVVVSITAIGY